MQLNLRDRLWLNLVVLLTLSVWAIGVAHAKPNATPRIEQVGNVRVMHLYGSHREMGHQHGRLLRDEVQMLYKDYFVRFAGGEIQIAMATKLAEFSMLPHIPSDYLEEMRGLAEGSGLEFKQVLLAQAFLDIKKIVQCSTVALSGHASAEGEPMLGRNLDFPSLGIAHRHSIIVVWHPTKGQTTVSVGWPLLLGTFSGMNEAGVSLAMMEVYTSDSSIAGMPYAFQYRRALEVSKSTADVVSFIQKGTHTASNNLMVLDSLGKSALLEITAKQIAVRTSGDGKLYATNHHRSPPLTQKTGCWRYPIIEKRLRGPATQLNMKQLTTLLDRVAQGEANLQAMIFFPKSRKLHLAVGQLPASKGPFIEIPSATLFGKK